MEQTYWRKCGNCKKDIGFNTIYQSCTVSGCQKFVYCSTDCWDIHNSIMNHKNGWAEEDRSPAKSEAAVEVASPSRRIIVNSSPTSNKTNSSSMDQEILIVASKLKQYIKEKFDMNTSAGVMEALSDHVRHLTIKAAENAKKEGRKTVMDRDF